LVAVNKPTKVHGALFHEKSVFAQLLKKFLA